MRSDLQRAKDCLQKNGAYTCVFCRGKLSETDSRRGILPLWDRLEAGRDYAEYCAADRVVGKAAAMLYILLHIRALWAGVISEPALEMLERHGVAVSYMTRTDAIVNRSKTGPCPMESAVLQCDDPRLAPALIREALEKLRTKGI